MLNQKFIIIILNVWLNAIVTVILVLNPLTVFLLLTYSHLLSHGKKGIMGNKGVTNETSI